MRQESSDEELLDELTSYIEVLKEWPTSDGNLHADERLTIQNVQRVLNSLEDNFDASLEWSYGTILVMGLTNTAISSKLKTISEKFVQNIHLIIYPSKEKCMREIWYYFEKKNELFSFLIPDSNKDTMLFLEFVQKCFQLAKKGHTTPAFQFVEKGTTTCLLGLSDRADRDHQAGLTENTLSLNKILRLVFDNLVEPTSPISKVIMVSVLKSCSLKIYNGIRNMLSPALLQPDESISDVYNVILELASIDQILVVGTINNTELCFQPGREDHELGLEFFCKLFSAESIGPKFYSCLWNNFLNHCRDIKACQSQMLILGKHTCSILAQPAAHMDWCSLLTYFFEYVLNPKVELCFVTGMIDALFRCYSMDIEPLMELFRKLLTSESIYERFGESRHLLITELGKAYKHIATIGANNMTLLKNHQISSNLITCFLGTCKSFYPSNERWYLLREIFVKYLVPFDFPAEERMKMLFYLWINSEDEWSVLQELFSKINQVRSCVKKILNIMTDKQTFERHKHHLYALKQELNFYLIQEYGRKEFGKALCSSKVRLVLNMLVSKDLSCNQAHKIAKGARHYLVPNENDENIEAVDGLIYYLSEWTVDKNALEHLLDLVNSCVMGDRVALLLNKNRLHVARTSLLLLKEVLLMLPHLGYNTHVLSKIVEWAKLKHGCLSMLSVQCLSSIAYTKTLDSWNHGYVVQDLVPLCVSIIKGGSRSQVKAAIQCLGKHANSQPFCDNLLSEVLNIISQQLTTVSKVSESFERGVSALGHFSSIRLSPNLAYKVANLCKTHLLPLITDLTNQEVMSSTSSSSICDSWGDWQELSFDVRIMLQAIRSIGRCMRYCSRPSEVEDTLTKFQIIICSPKENIRGNFRSVDIDHLQYETACAILNIFEADVNHTFISKQLVISLSHIIADSREEVRVEFAKKLCQGLSPHKIFSNIRGQKRGNLPACMLGILALLGSQWWRQKTETKQLAGNLLQEVFVSRHIYRMKKKLSAGVTYEELFKKNPHLVFENILVTALPILAEQRDFQISEDEVGENYDAIFLKALCFDFVCAMLCHPRTFGGILEKDYMMKLVTFSKTSIHAPLSDSLHKKYCLLFDVLQIVAKEYKSSKEVKLATPPMLLPPPFFHNREDLSSSFETLLPPHLVGSIKRNLKEMSTYAGEQGDETESDENFDDASSASFERISSNSSFGRSLMDAAHSTPATYSTYQ